MGWLKKSARAASLKEATEQAEAIYAPFLRKASDDPYHVTLPDFCARCAAIPNYSILEIGSRAVSGTTRRHLFPTAERYVGLDIHEGPGVDLIGDAHGLSTIFSPNEFDAVFSVSVFEHLAFPWKAVMEINTVLKPGGLCYLSTHPNWPPHEQPWDFWRFPVAGLHLLFSPPLGFAVIRSAEGIPGKVHSLVDEAPTRGLCDFELPLGVSLLAQKVGDYDREKIRWDVPLSSVLKTEYPAPLS
ncbi:MAG: class I SAM-dependent methyltransferase [Verrucomicrobiota bacterium]|nr:class I SAM-dependent methyltransferase [Verrucomicrobiota bacterium]